MQQHREHYGTIKWGGSSSPAPCSAQGPWPWPHPSLAHLSQCPHSRWPCSVPVCSSSFLGEEVPAPQSEVHTPEAVGWEGRHREKELAWGPWKPMSEHLERSGHPHLDSQLCAATAIGPSSNVGVGDTRCVPQLLVNSSSNILIRHVLLLYLQRAGVAHTPGSHPSPHLSSIRTWPFSPTLHISYISPACGSP